MAVHYNFAGDRINTDGLVLFLDSNNPNSYNLSTPLVWRDISGAGNNGTLVNGTSVVSTTAGNVVNFDGVNDYVTFNTPAGITTTTPQTWEVWCAVVAGKPYDWGYAVHNNLGSQFIGSSFVTIGVNTSNMCFATFQGNYNVMYSDVVFGSTTQIKHIVLVWDGATQTMYVNGVTKASAALTGPIQNLDTKTTIGSNYITPDYRPGQGKIPVLRIYNRALSQSEITQNFEASRKRFNI